MLWVLWALCTFLVFITGWAAGYKEGKQDQKEILVRLRKQIANR